VRKGRVTALSFMDAMQELHSYEYEERAAIKEFDGGLSREEAERQASAETETA
jgi:hypothetical protein